MFDNLANTHNTNLSNTKPIFSPHASGSIQEKEHRAASVNPGSSSSTIARYLPSSGDWPRMNQCYHFVLGPDPVYEELSQDTLLRNKAKGPPDSLELQVQPEPTPVVRVSFNAVNEITEDSEDDFLEPTQKSDDKNTTDSDDGYLTPKNVRKKGRQR